MPDKTRKQHFEDVVANVIGRIGHSLPPDQARINVQKAFRKIADSHDWYHQVSKGYVIAPKGYSGGGQGAFTSGSRLVIVDSSVQAYLDGISLVDLQSVSVKGPDGRLYEIQQWFSSTTKVILAQPYLGETVLSGFVTVCQYVRLPYKPVEFTATDDQVEALDATGWLIDDSFRNIVSLRSVDKNIQITYKPTPKPWRKDNVAYADSCHYEISPSFTKGSNQYFQLWPEYKATDKNLVFECVYSTTGGEFHEDLSGDFALTPLAFSAELIELYASHLCCLWAESNKTTITALKTSNWLQLARDYRAQYDELFYDAVRRDRELHSLESQQTLYGQEVDRTLNSPGLGNFFNSSLGLTIDGKLYM